MIFCYLLQQNSYFSLRWNILNPKLKEMTVVVYDYLVVGGSQNYVTLMTVPDFSADGDGNDDGVYDAEYVNYD